MKTVRQSVEEAANFIMTQTPYRPRIGLILGTGLESVADEASRADIIPYTSVPNFPKLTVEGHVGELVIGEMEGWPLAIMCGRPHFYEGHSMDQIGFPVRVLREIGCETLIVTNAAGGLNPSLQAGDLMLISDHINLPGMVGFNPLFGFHGEGLGPSFVSMALAYDPELARLAHAAAKELRIPLKNGVYAMVAGPSYETGAELNFLRVAGADAVGMSTAPEVVVARHCSMRVLGISCITNSAIGAEHGELTHAEVLARGRVVAPRLAALIRGFLRLLPR